MSVRFVTFQCVKIPAKLPCNDTICQSSAIFRQMRLFSFWLFSDFDLRFGGQAISFQILQRGPVWTLGTSRVNLHDVHCVDK